MNDHGIHIPRDSPCTGTTHPLSGNARLFVECSQPLSIKPTVHQIVELLPGEAELFGHGSISTRQNGPDHHRRAAKMSEVLGRVTFWRCKRRLIVPAPIERSIWVYQENTPSSMSTETGSR